MLPQRLDRLRRNLYSAFESGREIDPMLRRQQGDAGGSGWPFFGFAGERGTFGCTGTEDLVLALIAIIPDRSSLNWLFLHDGSGP
jgi:hypothetical protein